MLGDACSTIVGGHHPTLSPGASTAMLSTPSIGEGEDTFRELVDHLSRGGGPQSWTPLRAFVTETRLAH
jgi:radical SAM superfamily enzyme YgiQ (UPF0313 family)